MQFTDLTWKDLNEWAGDKIVSRGKLYLEAVKNLCVTSDGVLLAWVTGSDRYAALVRMDVGGNLSTQCTCPYDMGPCKHAVAVILTYLDAKENKRDVPPAEPDDERLGMLEAAEEFDMDEIADDESVLPEQGGSPKPSLLQEDEALRNQLNRLSKNELVELIVKRRGETAESQLNLPDRKELKDLDINRIVASTRREIDKVSQEPGWSDEWSEASFIPDYSGVRRRLETLLSVGKTEEVVELGSYLLEKGIRQIEMSNDDGDTATEISECMDVVFKALMRSKMPASQRLLWEIDAHLQDDYDLLDGLKGPVDSAGDCCKEDWSVVADTLVNRIASMPVRSSNQNDDNFSNDYHREQVMRWLIHALKHAGRSAEVIPVLERETAHTHCYVVLVQHLIEANLVDKALDWARKGFQRTAEKLPGIARDLEVQLREIAEREKNYPLAAAFRAMEFFEEPGLQSYSALEKAAKKTGVWDEIKKRILDFLETGRRPDIPKKIASRSSKHKEESSGNAEKDTLDPTDWPLPSPGLQRPRQKGLRIRIPDTSTLIDIAIKENRNDEVLRWYRHEHKTKEYWGDYKGVEVADAVQNTHPDDAVAIWKELAAGQIAQVNPRAYQTAGGYISKVRRVHVRTNRKTEWNVYLSGLRSENSRRPRMMEVLDSLEAQNTRIMKRS